jgi:excisionase family DNA binding protein
MGRLLTVAEVATILNLSEKTIRRLIERGDLETVRIGRSVRISQEALAALIEARRS